MRVIRELEINGTIEVFESLSEDEMSAMVEQFSMEQDGLVNYIMSDKVAPLSQDERQVLLYLSLVIWKVSDEGFVSAPNIPLDILSDKEEANWNKLSTQPDSMPFLEKISVLYLDYDQEDLLAFVEDSIAETEGVFAKEAREPMFVMMKSVVDSFSELVEA